MRETLSYPRPLMDPVVRRFKALKPAQADAVLAVALAMVLAGFTPAVPVSHGYRHVDALAVGLAAVSALALAFRRRAPIATWAASLAPMLVYQARAYPGGPALLAPLVALYTLGSMNMRWRALGCGALTAGLMAAARLIFSSEPLGTLVTDAIGFIGAALFLGWAVANRRAYVAEVQNRAQRAERLRIARELHDAVAHSIATISVQAGAATHVIDEHPDQAADALEVIRQTSRQALAELREVLGVLRQGDEAEPRAPAAGMAELENLLERVRARGLRVELEVEGQRAELPRAVNLAAYRIVQESLTNVSRHAAAATHARVHIAYEPSALRLRVSDDGSPGARFSNGSGHGIVGMRERAEALGGTLQASPRPVGGFEVCASLPLSPQA